LDLPVLTSLPLTPFLGVDEELLLGLVGDEGRDGTSEEQHGREGDAEDVGLRLVVDVNGCVEKKIYIKNIYLIINIILLHLRLFSNNT
jgi:hypothetical protein